MAEHHLRSEQIYDALLDEDAFAQLPSTMAATYGARSCTLHWWYPDGSADIMSHSGYFSDEQMLDYANNFTGTDLWSLEGMKDERTNRVWNCDELVSTKTYEKSEFYNEWIRTMGDDTFHCIGSVQKTPWGRGFVGFHRGRSQGPFENGHVRSFEHDLVHLRRMLSIRGRIAEGLRRARQAEAVLDTAGQAFLGVTADARIVSSNLSADAMIFRDDGLQVRRSVLSACTRVADRKLKDAIRLAADPSCSQASAVSVPRSNGGRYDLTIVALNGISGPRQVLITILDPDAKDSSLERRLRALYGLSSAEAEIAVSLSEGGSPADIAASRRVSLDTVRVQLKVIYQKLQCSRQAEVVALVGRLPPLNCPTTSMSTALVSG